MMTRVEAKEMAITTVINKIDKIYDDFENSTCDDCKYKYVVSYDRTECRCDASIIDFLEDYEDASLSNFACKYFIRSK